MADRPDPQASEVRVAVGWDGLAETERNFLREAAAAVQAVIPGAELWLFGSRSWGGAEPTSDYDVLLVMPDGTPTEMRSSAMGGIWLAAQRRGKTVDHKHVGRSLFVTRRRATRMSCCITRCTPLGSASPFKPSLAVWANRQGLWTRGT